MSELGITIYLFIFIFSLKATLPTLTRKIEKLRQQGKIDKASDKLSSYQDFIEECPAAAAAPLTEGGAYDGASNDGK